MANKNRKNFNTKVYNRKILRNMLKKYLGTNKIRNAWHQFKAEGRI